MRLTLTTFLTMLALTMMSSSAWADVINPKPFDEILKGYVDRRGRVDYAGLKANEADLKKLTDFVAATASARVKGSDKEKLAFYINAYNANVIKSVVEKYPITSVMKVKGFFKAEKHSVAGKKLTLDALENELIRKEFKEARIHFVLVCAARSCPRLQRQAATAKNLESMLESAAKEFVPKATKVSEGKIVTSKLFDWFKDDFIAAEGSVRAYLAKYDPANAAAIKDEKNALSFSSYSWKLNKQPKKKPSPTTQPSK